MVFQVGPYADHAIRVYHCKYDQRGIAVEYSSIYELQGELHYIYKRNFAQTFVLTLNKQGSPHSSSNTDIAGLRYSGTSLILSTTGLSKSGHVERGSSVGRMPDSQSREPGFESPLLPFRSLGIFFHFTTPQSTQLSK